MSAPVTAEELAGVDAQAAAAMASAERIDLNLEGFDDCTEVGDMARVQAMIELAPRLARDLTAERARAAEIEADRDALAAKIETMLRDEEDARALRLAEHAAREDVAGKLAELQAAVRAHRAAHEAGEGETVALVRLYQFAEQA